MRSGGEAIFCVVDLHSITTPFEPEALREATLSVFTWLIATGLDPEKSIVFVQSQVRAHPEAAWLLGAVTSFGELRRMTQFKEKAEGQEFVSAGFSTTRSSWPRTSSSTAPTSSPSATTSASTSSLHATSPSASTSASARRSSSRAVSTPRKVRGSRTCRSRNG